jgi:hypothetical protein
MPRSVSLPAAGAGARHREARHRPDSAAPAKWPELLAAEIDASDKFTDVPIEARPLIRQSAIMAAAAGDPRLKKRTLTNLYNERPTWLRLAHEKLDRAVLAAYAATDASGEWSEDWSDVWTETGAGLPLTPPVGVKGQPLPDAHPLAARRAEIDQRVLANLLRLNLARTDARGALEKESEHVRRWPK